ncbi:hypothetical protein [Oerskovia enterophila]|uniref:hypothetical protein n=1 Tax=Oerskovia enterophila TaxID=43678 RepID=UPI00382BDA19
MSRFAQAASVDPSSPVFSAELSHRSSRVSPISSSATDASGRARRALGGPTPIL